MTDLSILERDKQPVDFRARLHHALEHAVPHTPDDPLKNKEIASRYSDKPDEYIISFSHNPGENEVYTSDAAEYLDLLKQAAEVLNGTTDQTDDVDQWLKTAADHEIAHGKAASSLGNSNTVSYYGVQFVVDQDGTPIFWPYCFTAGPLKKVHQAWVAVAPEDRSETDIAIAKDLGYDEDFESLRHRALQEAPVVEGWERPSPTKDEVISALQRMMLSDLEPPTS